MPEPNEDAGTESPDQQKSNTGDGGGTGTGTTAAGAKGSDVQGGGGGGMKASLLRWLLTPPSDTPVGSGAIILTTVFLMLLTVLMLGGITLMWPACDPPDQQEAQNQNGNRNGNANGNGNGNSNGNTNAGARGNSNVNTNTNASANANGNVNANGNANTNTNGNANGNTGGVAPSNVNAGAGGGASPTPSTAQAAASPAAAGGAVLRAIDPTSGSVLGNTPVTIKGKNLLPADGLAVKFGEDEVKPFKVTEDSISVRTPKHAEGVVDVAVVRNDKVEDVLTGAYTYVCAAPQGSALFWMLVMAGTLGGCIHAMRSLWWYTGQGTLKWRWLLMYYCLPFTGAATAMLFGLLIVAGLIDSSAGRNRSLFIIAIAGLVGMFTQQAALKLTDIANAIFTKPGEGRDSDPQPSLPAGGTGTGDGRAPQIAPTSGPAAGNTPVAITGTGFNDVAQVLFDTKPSATTPAVSPDKNTITATAPQHEPGTVTVTVTNKAGAVKTLKYEYK